ncbi:MAG: hypothetical protein U1E70_13630 [Acetobacteraceae bacterium]
MTSKAHQDKMQDKASADSFPASDPPANTGITGAGDPKRDRGQDDIPTGHPTSDRHAMETAHQQEPDEKGIDAARDLSNDAAAD